MIRADYKAYRMTLGRLILGLFTHHAFYAVLLYRIGNWFYRHHIKLIPELLKAIQLRVFACEISPYAKIGAGLKIYHTVGIVIGWDCEIGENCEIFQNVTMGENRRKTVLGERRMPKIGNNVSIYAGACLIGSVTVGDNVQIGANSVVIEDVESDTVVAGIPAKVIHRKDD